MELTREQRQIIGHHDASSFRVIAAAGSGKTTTMALFVEQAITTGRYSESEICFITFTRLAASEIRSKMRRHVGRCTSILCGTFHKTMFILLQQAGIATPEQVHLYDGCMERTVEFILEQMRAKLPALVAILQKYRLLIVDEFQDLDPIQFEFIKLFREIQPVLQVVAIGDLAQNIYRFRGTSNEFLRRLLKTEVAPELASYSLTTNFRSNPLILQCVNYVFAAEITDGHVLPMIAGKTDLLGMMPEYYEYSRNPGGGIGEYERKVVETLIPVITTARSDCKSVALIFPIIKCLSYEIILAHLQHAVGDRLDFHRIAKEDANCAIVEIEYDPRNPDAPIQCASFHASKGLEWDIVALINVDDSVYELREGDTDDEGFYQEKTNLLYVGMTRAIERLLIFANTNNCGRHRLLARHEEGLSEVMTIVKWGVDEHQERDRGRKQIGVEKLVKQFAQHPDLFTRVRLCSEKIPSVFHTGVSLPFDEVYSQMKIRNRELAFGTFMDRMIKRALSHTPTLQSRLLELFTNLSATNWFHKDVKERDIEGMLYTLNEFFDRTGNLPSTGLQNYIRSARIIAGYCARRYFMDPPTRALYSEVERRIVGAYKKESKTVIDEYIISQAESFLGRGHHSEIKAVDAPVNSYCGLPHGFEEFATYSVVPAAAIIRAAVGISCDDDDIHVDIPVESHGLIMGETDVVIHDGIIDIKCGGGVTSAELRGASSCANLLQLLAYVAIGRHGTIPLLCNWAMLINPLTATWERYDISAWKEEDSREFMDCLEELQRRS